jgi:hypothetical protein
LPQAARALSPRRQGVGRARLCGFVLQGGDVLRGEDAAFSTLYHQAAFPLLPSGQTRGLPGQWWTSVSTSSMGPYIPLPSAAPPMSPVPMEEPPYGPAPSHRHSSLISLWKARAQQIPWLADRLLAELTRSRRGQGQCGHPRPADGQRGQGSHGKPPCQGHPERRGQGSGQGADAWGSLRRQATQQCTKGSVPKTPRNQQRSGPRTPLLRGPAGEAACSYPAAHASPPSFSLSSSHIPRGCVFCLELRELEQLNNQQFLQAHPTVDLGLVGPAAAGLGHM